MSVSTKPDPGHTHHIIKRSVSRTRSGRRSDSDASAETASLSADGGGGGGRRLTTPAAPASTQGMQRSPRLERAPDPPNRGKKNRRRGSEWEVLEGLKGGQRFDLKPDVFNGYLHKKRKWPLKGWHKRYFVLECGILVYARTPRDISRGRLHGSVDVGLSVVSAEHSQRRVDIDAEEFIYHLKAKTPEAFRAWVSMLRTHRLYRQHLLTFGVRDSGRIDVNYIKFPKATVNYDSSSESDSKQSTPSKGSDDLIIGESPEDYNDLSPSPLSITSRDDAYGRGYVNVADNTRTKTKSIQLLNTPHMPSFSPISTVYNFLQAGKPSCLTSSISSAPSPPVAARRPKNENGKRRPSIAKEKDFKPKEKRNKSGVLAKQPQTKANRPRTPEKQSAKPLSIEKPKMENNKSKALTEFVKLPENIKAVDAFKAKATQSSKLKQALTAVRQKRKISVTSIPINNGQIRHSKKSIDLTNFSPAIDRNDRLYDPSISYVKVYLDQQPSLDVSSFHMGKQLDASQHRLDIGSKDTFVIENLSCSNSPVLSDKNKDQFTIGGSDYSNPFIGGKFLYSVMNIVSEFRDMSYMAVSRTRDLDVTGVLKRLISKYSYNRMEDSLLADDASLDRLSECLRVNTKSTGNNLPLFNLKFKVLSETEKNEVYSRGMCADLDEVCSCCLLDTFLAGMATENDTRAGFVSGTPGGTLSSWVIEEGSPLECVARELSAAQASVRQLQTMLDSLELHHQRLHQNQDTDASVEGVSPGVRKDKRKFGLRKKKSSSKTSMDLMLPVSTNDSGHLSASCGPAPPSPQASSTSVHNTVASTILGYLFILVPSVPLILVIFQNIKSLTLLMLAVAGAYVMLAENGIPT